MLFKKLDSHSSPIWGNAQNNDFLKLQRDNYALLHNQSLRLANNGVGIQDIGDAIQETIPETVYIAWHTNGYHGIYSHNAKAVYNKYLGYFDMNPSNDTARQLLADIYEQLGYQSEGAGWRKTYLTGVLELRVGIQKGAPKTASADVVSEIDMPTLFDFLACK